MKTDKQYVPIAIVFIFIAVNVYVAALNWGVFSTVLNIELGFGTVAMPPFLFLFFFGLALMLIFWFFEYRKDLKHHIHYLEDEAKIQLLEKDMEIESLKSQTGQQKKQEEKPEEKPDKKMRAISPASKEVGEKTA